MKKRLFTLLLAVMVVATSVPVYAGNEKAGKTKTEVSAYPIGDAQLQSESDEPLTIEFSDSVPDYSMFENAIKFTDDCDDEIDLTEEDVDVSALDGEEIADLNGSGIPKPGRPSLKILARYSDRFYFRIKSGKNTTTRPYLYFYEITQKKAAGKLDKVTKQPYNYYSRKYMPSIPASTGTGSDYELTRSDWSGLTPGAKYYVSVFVQTPGGTVMSKPVALTVPSAPVGISGTMVQQKYNKYYYAWYVQTIKRRWTGFTWKTISQKVTSKVLFKNASGKPIYLKKNLTYNGTVTKNGFYSCNNYSYIFSPATYFKSGKGCVKSSVDPSKETPVVFTYKGVPSTLYQYWGVSYWYDGGWYTMSSSTPLN